MFSHQTREDVNVMMCSVAIHTPATLSTPVTQQDDSILQSL